MKIQRANNLNNLTSFEQMHLPWIVIPEFIKKGKEFEVLVKIGKVDHPMGCEHYIRCIRLYLDGNQQECKTLKIDNHSESKFKVCLEKDCVISARTECNLHGIWESEVKIILYRGNNDENE